MKKLFAFVVVSLIGYQSFAQDSVKITEMSPVLVTAVRADKFTPITQKTIGDTAIQSSYQGQEVPILLGSYPSMYSNTDGGHSQGYTYVSMRGASQNRINMTLNSVPLNEPEDHGVHTSNFPSFINAIQSIQIQRGVGSSTNGSAAFIGSINFQSKTGLNRGSEIQIGAGSFNTFRLNAAYSSGLKNKHASFLNVGMMTTDGFRQNSGSHGGSIFYTRGYYGEKRITKFVVFSGFSRNQMAWEASDEDVLKVNYRDNPRGNDRKDFFNQTHIQIHNTNIFNKQSKLTSILFVNHLEGNYDVFNKESLPTLGYYAQENQYSNWAGYITQYDYKNDNVKLSVGLSLNTYRRNHFGTEFVMVDSSVLKSNYQNYGNKNEASSFVKLIFGPEELKMYFDLQARYVDFKYVGDKALGKYTWLFTNPKVGFKYFLDKNTNVYYSIGMSHREPTRNILFNGGLYLTDLNNVKPEEVVDLELGVNHKGDKLTLQANLYYMSFQNEIIPAGPMGANSLPMMINVDKSFRKGIEFDIDYTINKSFQYSVNGSISNSRFGVDNKQQLFSPNRMFNQSLTYTNKAFSMNVNQSIYSKAYIDIENQFSVPACTTIGFNASYSYKNLVLSLQGNNITNNKFYFNGYAMNNKRFLFPTALANYFVTLRIKI